MTVLGKILAIVNLVFSLAVAAFIVMTFVARTNWHNAYNDIDKQLKAAVQNTTSMQTENEAIRQKFAASQNELKAANDKLNVEKADAANKTATLQTSLDLERIKVAKLDNTLNANVAELQSRQREVEYGKTLIAQRDETIKQWEARYEQANNLKTEYEIARDSEHGRNVNLLAQVEKLTKDLQKSLQSGGTGAPVPSGPHKNPPTEDIEGLVKATDSESGYVTLTVGSDAGLSKGQTLEVFRLKPEPAYLGTVEILAVRHDQAVAKPTARLRGTIQVGDQVSSSVTNRR